jgi:hypothetical protein
VRLIDKQKRKPVYTDFEELLGSLSGHRCQTHSRVGERTKHSVAKSKKREKVTPRCLLIAGPNGAAKTTFAREYLPNDVRVLNFVNADLIDTGLSPLKPELAAIAAARLMLGEIDRLTELSADFAWESTLSGLTYAKRIRAMKQFGYHVEVIYLTRIIPIGIAPHRK